MVFGRQSGKAAAVQLMQEALAGGGSGGSAGKINVEITPGSNSVTVTWEGGSAGAASSATASGSSSAADAKEEESGAKVYTMDEVAKHATKDDCWVVVNGDVYDVTGTICWHCASLESCTMRDLAPASSCSPPPLFFVCAVPLNICLSICLSVRVCLCALWVIASDFLEDHPGGANAILLYAGGDASKEFNMMHKPQILTKYGGQYRIGAVAENTQARL